MITLTQSYTPFGEVLTSTGEGQTDYAFTGEMFDPETGLVYLRARYYGVGDGRFLSRDTWNGDSLLPITLLKWIYTNNNPLIYIDPSGNCIDMDIDGVCDKVPPFEQITFRSDMPNIPPEGISWDPQVNVSIIELSGYKNQFSIISTNEKAKDICEEKIVYENGTEECIISEYGKAVYGACGTTSLSAIAKINPIWLFNKAYDWKYKVTFKNDRNEDVSAFVDITPNYTGVEELLAIAKNIGWYSHSWNKLTEKEGLNKLKSEMKNNWYPIVGVSANTSGALNPNKGGHWVVVTGLSEEKLWNLGTEFQWVRIYNPASNRLEYFPWNYFLSTWGTASDLSGKPSYINRIIISIHSPFVSPVKGFSRLE